MHAPQAIQGFRTCPVTGLLCHIATLRLITANYAMALISIVIGGIAAIFVGLSRSSLVLLRDPGSYYLWLTAHGVNMLIFWILWFEVALLYFVGTVLLNAPIYSVRAGWTAFGLMLVGWILIEYTVFSGRASVLFTAYPPLAADPLFYAGYIVYVLGAGFAVVTFFLTLYRARVEGRYKGSLPLVTWGAAVAAIIAVTVVVHGLIALAYTAAWLSGSIPMNVMIYRWFFWGLGHDAQYVNVTAMVAVWYALLALSTGLAAAKFVNERYAKIAFAMYVLFVVPGIGHHILVDPGFSTALKQASGSVGSHFLSIPSMLHALALLGGLEALLRASGYSRGLFSWFKAIPWRNPGTAGLLLSMLLFGIGGIIAQPQTTLQPNLLFHNTMWVPAHFHLTVVGGTTLAFMAISYYLIPLITLRRLFSVSIARIQIYLAFIGILIMTISMSILGWLGAPRRTLILPEEFAEHPYWVAPATALGIGAIIFIASGVLYVLNAILTILAGRRTTDPKILMDGLITPYEVKDPSAARKTGSLVIVIIILVIVLLGLYFASFIRLASLPPIW
ncbi:MAG: cbb3-type cytochrome c oxidase subunit I [Sulfolobales archaeon]